jgi:hypothetical protein
VGPWSAKHVRDVKIKQMMNNNLEMDILSLEILIIAIFIVRFKKGDKRGTGYFFNYLWKK